MKNILCILGLHKKLAIGIGFGGTTVYCCAREIREISPWDGVPSNVRIKEQQYLNSLLPSYNVINVEHNIIFGKLLKPVRIHKSQ